MLLYTPIAKSWLWGWALVACATTFFFNVFESGKVFFCVCLVDAYRGCRFLALGLREWGLSSKEYLWIRGVFTSLVPDIFASLTGGLSWA